MIEWMILRLEIRVYLENKKKNANKQRIVIFSKICFCSVVLCRKLRLIQPEIRNKIFHDLEFV